MKILILYTAHTLGHKQIAENLAYWLRLSGEEVAMEEVLKSNPSRLVIRFLKLHVWVNKKIPWFWGFMYRYGFWLTMPLRLPVAKKFTASVLELLHKYEPDVVITTQTSASAVMSILKKDLYKGRWFISFSDFHFHRYWMYPRADGYLVNIEQQKLELIRRGVEESRVLVFGMGLYDLEGKSRVDVREKLRVKSEDKLVLVNMGGGTLQMGLDQKLGKALIDFSNLATKNNKSFRVVLACGRDEEMLKQAQAVFASDRHFEAVGFYTPFRDLIKSADVCLGKAGGLTTAECLYQGIPVIVYSYLPGQEEENMKFLEAGQLVYNLCATNESKWGELIYRLVFESETLSGVGKGGKPLVSRELNNVLIPFLKGE